MAAHRESPPPTEEREEPLEEKAARGRSAATPVLVIGSLAATIWALVAVLASGALLLWWLL